MQGKNRPNINTQLIIGALKFAEFPDHISIDYAYGQRISVILSLQKYDITSSMGFILQY